jgi:hypothetical protein
VYLLVVDSFECSALPLLKRPRASQYLHSRPKSPRLRTIRSVKIPFTLLGGPDKAFRTCRTCHYILSNISYLVMYGGYHQQRTSFKTPSPPSKEYGLPHASRDEYSIPSPVSNYGLQSSPATSDEFGLPGSAVVPTPLGVNIYAHPALALGKFSNVYYSHNVQPSVLDEGAIRPPCPQLTIRCTSLPWICTVESRNNGQFVTVGDVTDALQAFLVKPVRHDELSRESSDRKAYISAICKSRVAAGAIHGGVIREDFLEGRCVGGLRVKRASHPTFELLLNGGL